MRARPPNTHGLVKRDGVRVAYEVYGDGEPTVLLLPTWSLYPSRFWKFQVPYLARRYRVLTFDGRGTGRSDSPTEPDAYSDREFAADAIAVLDATGTGDAVVVGFSCGATWGLRLAADHAERALGLATIGPAVPLAPGLPERVVQRFDQRFDGPVGWQKYNAHHWRADYCDFVEWFVPLVSSEPHSTKQIEDGTGWAMEVGPDVLSAATFGLRCFDAAVATDLASRVKCPTLVMHGTDDRVRAFAQGEALATILGGEFVAVEGGAHDLHARQPVLVNLMLRSFVGRCARRRGIHASPAA